MQVGDLVTLTDARGEHTGTIVKVSDTGFDKGIVLVKWASGVSERVHESELKKIGLSTEGAPKGELDDPAPTFLTTKQDEVVRDMDDDSGYEQDDPKHPTWRERLSALWDSRSGK